MNYIYDVLLNYDSVIYDHYEWDLNDNIYHIKKIPLFKVKSSVIDDFFNYNVIVSQDFILKIRNKTEMYLSKTSKPIEFACILCNEERVLAIKLDNKGRICRYSKMLISEELETIENEEMIPYTDIGYIKDKKKNRRELKTKLELKKTEYLKSKLKSSSKEELDYLYYEIYNEKPNGVDVRLILEKELFDWNDRSNKMYEFFTLIASRK